jgi:uncharacterized protein YjaZ
LEIYNAKAETIDLEELNRYFLTTVESMTEFTGYQPKGKWYIFFGPKWTNAGGINDGIMLIDLAHSSNTSIEDIQKFFPHEVNHQIYFSTMQANTRAVLGRILDEGFATYVSYLYHNRKKSIARELGYTEEEYQICRTNDKKLIAVLAKYYQSDDNDLSRQFANRGYKISEEYPGAVGYYIGFRIVEEYVKHQGENSWKDIYTLAPEEVLKKSRILESGI